MKSTTRIPLLAVMVLALFGALHSPARAQNPAPREAVGPFGPEGPRLREQLWLVPAPQPGEKVLRATVFRPSGETPKRLAVINHGTGADREGISMPVFFTLARFLVTHGDFVVVVPVRRGYGATGGEFRESAGTCADPRYEASEKESARDIAAVISFMREQPFVAKEGALVLGGSTGGLGSLATLHYFPELVGAVVNFSGGRGGRVNDEPGRVCNADALVRAMGNFGRGATKPSLWLYADNDTYFPGDLAKRMVAAYRENGGNARFHLFPPFKQDGHAIMTDADAFRLWGPFLGLFLAREVP